MHVSPRHPRHIASLRAVCIGTMLLCLPALSSSLHAHHNRQALAVASAKCGWIAGDDIRDRSNLSDFCAQSVPATLQIKRATAAKQQLWIEAPPDLVSTLRDDTGTTAALLRDWLARWRTISGYRTASVVLLRSHMVVARIDTTMTGDTVRIR